MTVERHPLEPFLPQGARVLFLGSFPPPRQRWSMEFFYPNFINDFWRIIGLVFFGEKEHFVVPGERRFDRERIVDFCKEKGIAMFDTATEVRRLQDNASDKFLEVVEPTDIPALIRQLPHLKAIVTTGEKATETICRTMGIVKTPKVNAYVDLTNTDGTDETDKLENTNLTNLTNGGSLILYRLPSSSRAYPLSFDKKVEAYRQFFNFINI
jgi:G:T/U-mismatch repair DNA glycosylase